MLADLKSMYDHEYGADLANAVKAVHSEFDAKGFFAQVFDELWEGRELKERMRHIAQALHDYLPSDYRTALAILQEAAPKLSTYGFQNMVFSNYVEIYGLEHWEASISALEQFTQLVSAEFAIRPFIMKYQERTLAQMLVWAQSDNPHLRRLASEGSRPQLPWGIALTALKEDPTPLLPILELLKDDEEENIRRSVANSLNDISKDNPDFVITTLRRWQPHADDNIKWITGHALRSLIKAGDPEALELLGYPTDPLIDVHNTTVTPATIPLGEVVTLSFDIISTGDEAQNLMIDFVVYLVRANGKQTPKVFKLSKKIIQPGETLHLEKTISFKPVTTRKYYPGEHGVAPKINGKLFECVAFTLT